MCKFTEAMIVAGFSSRLGLRTSCTASAGLATSSKMPPKPLVIPLSKFSEQKHLLLPACEIKLEITLEMSPWDKASSPWIATVNSQPTGIKIVFKKLPILLRGSSLKFVNELK